MKLYKNCKYNKYIKKKNYNYVSHITKLELTLNYLILMIENIVIAQSCLENNVI